MFQVPNFYFSLVYFYLVYLFYLVFILFCSFLCYYYFSPSALLLNVKVLVARACVTLCDPTDCSFCS